METPLQYPAFPAKSPSEILDYAMDFSGQMTEDGDEVAEVVAVTSNPGGLVVQNQTRVGNVVHCWVSGGVLGRIYLLEFAVTTVGGRTYNRSGQLPVQTR